MRLSIRWKLLLGVVVPLVALLGLLVWQSSRARRADAVEQQKLVLLRDAELLAGRFDGEFRTLAQLARALAAEAASDPAFAPADAERFARRALSFGSMVDAVRLTLESWPGGQPGPATVALVRRADGVIEPADVSGTPAPPASALPASVVAWTEPYADPAGGGSVFVDVTAPVMHGERTVGEARLRVRADRLQLIAERPGPSSAPLVVVLSRRGAVVCSRHGPWNVGDTYVTLATKEGQPEYAEIGAEMVSGRSGARLVPRDAAGKAAALVAYTTIPANGWSVAVASDEADILGPVYLALRDRAVSAVGVLALVAATVVGIGYWLTRPLRRLAEGVQALESSSNFDAPLVRVRTQDEIGDLARSFNRVVRQLRRRVQELTDAKAAEEKVASELRVAREIQASLFPTMDPSVTHRPGWTLAAVNLPALAVAGDFFDFFPLPDGRLALVIADVSGKGVPASLFMAVARTVLRDLATGGEPPGRVLTEANRRLLLDNRSGMFVTVLLAYFDPATGTLSYANAGHPPPLAARGSHVRTLAPPTGTVLGVLPEQQWATGQEALEVGERLVLFTDGVPEARGPDGEFLGEARLHDILVVNQAAAPEALCAAMADRLEAWQGADRRTDDVTILVLQRTPMGAPAEPRGGPLPLATAPSPS